MAEQDPAWEGEGRDPWLPARLQQIMAVLAAEKEVRETIWSVLSNWLVGTSRRVLRSTRPDPDSIFARQDEWQSAVDTFLRRAIRPLLGEMYTRLLGDTFPWEARPFVTRHLIEVTNRLVRVPDEVFDIVAGEVAEGANAGESIPEIRDRVENVLSTTATPRWENRATVIARTETIGAMNGGKNDSFQAVEEETGEEFEKLWLSTDDFRTRPAHVVADQQRVPVSQTFTVGGEGLMFPGDPTGRPDNVIQCRCTQLLMRPGESIDLSNRQFRS